MEDKGRRLHLIASFVNGFAENWYFAVRDCFKDELDIKFTERKENGKTIKRWTQGQGFDFKEGHVIYDTPDAYLTWGEALKRISLVCEVLRGMPNKTKNAKNIEDGWVTFKLSKPNKDKTNIETISQHTISQDEFVQYLKSGQLPS